MQKKWKIRQPRQLINVEKLMLKLKNLPGKKVARKFSVDALKEPPAVRASQDKESPTIVLRVSNDREHERIALSSTQLER
jgi:hypothetical protein